MRSRPCLAPRRLARRLLTAASAPVAYLGAAVALAYLGACRWWPR